MEKQHKFSIWYVLLGIWVVLLFQNYLAASFAIKTIPYSEFLKLLKEHKVSEVAISANQIQGRMVDDTGKGKGQQFKTVRVDPEISSLMEQYNVAFKGQVESTFLRTSSPGSCLYFSLSGYGTSLSNAWPDSSRVS